MMNILTEIKNCQVEWRTLGEVCQINKGKQLNKTLLSESGKYPAFNGGKTHSGWTDNYNVEANTVIISQGGASAGFVNFVESKFWANAHCYYLLPNFSVVENRFLYHFLKLNEQFFMSSQHGAGIPALSLSKLSCFKIPLPPLPIQEKIVKILDIFTKLEATLEATLEAELILRKKQYHYYRDLLLGFGDDVEWRSLGEVVDYIQPSKYLVHSTDYHDSFKIPVLTAGKTFILGYTNETDGIYPASDNPVIIFDDFTTANKWVNFDFKAKSSAMKIIVQKDNQVLLRYVYHWLNTLPDEESTDHKRQWISNFSKKPIPIPPLSTQTQIVAILDKFDTLTNSITDGLPKEIELRRKQYEYYRELLLGFW
ncbi:restriction endonuclease subunit S [Moraxella nasovis]|uniref:restriction endonuclease subunit S n=1 Tax=Moraxella nasovis TaxID=2904121 RepID=UPI001F615924|nr:restriction endonuclease subunit S [Moraxella nasovis]UNU72556.1 restriction endonuclease subunit S [Moraxella nasovis]